MSGLWLVIVVAGCVGLVSACLMWVLLETVADRFADRRETDDGDGAAPDLVDRLEVLAGQSWRTADGAWVVDESDINDVITEARRGDA